MGQGKRPNGSELPFWSAALSIIDNHHIRHISGIRVHLSTLVLLQLVHFAQQLP